MLEVTVGKTERVPARQLGMGRLPNCDAHLSPNALEWFIFDEARCLPRYVIEVRAIHNWRTAANDVSAGKTSGADIPIVPPPTCDFDDYLRLHP